MAQGRVERFDRMMWNYTSELLAKMHNTALTFSGAKHPKFIAADSINPYTAKQAGKQQKLKVPITVLKAFLPKGKSNGR